MVDLGRGELASGLELARRLLDPDSKSTPHVTVRYSKLALTPEQQHEYTRVRIDDLTLGEPLTLDRLIPGGAYKTLVFRCESPTLEAQIYKPDFFQTISHCTIYDGAPSSLAFRALEVLKQFEWNLMFPPGLRIKPYFKSPSPRSLSAGASKLAVLVWPWSRGQLGAIDALDEDGRLAALVTLFRHLCSGTPRASSRKGRERPKGDGGRPLRQESFQPALIPLGDALPRALDGGSVDSKAQTRSGVVVTPPELAAPIVHHLRALRGSSTDPIRFGDPAIGAGVFFAHVRRLGIEIAAATGVEVNGLRADSTAFTYRDLGLRVLKGDFLALQPELGSWNFIAANPPYLRSQKLPPSALRIRGDLERSLNQKISGRADLYMYFILAAHAWMAPGAVAAWLVPSEFAVTKAGKTLRQYLTSSVELLQLHYFESGESQALFQDVLVTSCVIFLRNNTSREGHRVRITRGPEINRPRVSHSLTAGELKSRTRWSISEIESPSPSVRRVAGSCIGDLFRVRRGIATGANGVFLLSQEAMRAMPGAERHVKPVLTRAHLLPKDGIITAGLDGVPLTDGIKWLIDSRSSISEIARESLPLATYLANCEHLAKGRVLVRKHRPQYYTQEQRFKPEFIFVYMSKLKGGVGNDRFFLNQSAATVLNNFLVLEPVIAVQIRLREDPDLAAKLLEALRAIPESELERHGRHYAGGLVKLEPSDLARVPWPDFEALDSLVVEDWIGQLARLGVHDS